MDAFRNPIDIANRGIDHCGGSPIDVMVGFAEQSKNAAVMSRIYDKLRRAELQRNTWRFAIKEVILRPLSTSTMLLMPALWSASTKYFVGSIVSDQDGTLWVSQIPNNLNIQPGAIVVMPGFFAAWAEYFGPLTVEPWDTSGTTAYSAGELVYTAAGDGTNRTYLSLISGNSDNPATATAWSATATYFQNQVVTFNSVAYMSLIDLNLNQEPDLAPALFNIATTYAAGAKVGGSDGLIYQSIGSGNIAHDPTTDGGLHWTNAGVLNPWTTVFVSGAGSLNWRQIGGAEFPSGVALAKLSNPWPLGAGPVTQQTTRNVFHLPSAFLRKAPQDPKAGSFSPLGAPSNDMYDDWEFESQYIVSSCTTPIRLRFVADTVDVTTFDDMFCEGLGARLGLEACEPLTQSSEKIRTIEGAYQRFMGDARTTNAILIGSDEPALDDWIACRA